MGQEKFSWLDQIAPKPAAPLPAPALIAPQPKPGEKKEKFSFLDEFAPGAAAAAVPGVLPPYPKKEPSYGIPYIIKETAKGAAADIGKVLTEVPKQPVQARFIAPPVTPATVAEFKPMATDVLEASQTIVRGVPAFAAGLAAQGITSLKAAWQKYLEKGPLGLTGMDILKSLGAPEAVEAGQEVMEQLGYEPKTAGGAELASAAMLPFELLDKGWEKVVNLATPDPALRQSFMFLGRAATFYLLPKATEYLKGVIKRGTRPDLVQLTKIINQEKTALPQDIQDGVSALNARLEEMVPTSARTPE